METKNFTEILKNRLRERKFTQKALADRLGITQSQVNNIIYQRDRLGIRNANRIGEILNVDPLWLMTGGEQGTPPSDEGAAVTTVDPDVIHVPVLNLDVRGGLLPNAEVDTLEYAVETMPFARSFAREGDVVVPVVGDSMAPRYPSGSYILIRPLPAWREWIELGQCYVLELNDWRRTIKIVRRGSSDDTYRLMSYNIDYDTTEIPRRLIVNMWQVISCVTRETM